MDKKLRLTALMLITSLLCSGTAIAIHWAQTAAPNGAAPIAHPVEGETAVSIPIELTLSATDADDDLALFQLTEQPRLGSAQISGQILTYSPGSKAGTDKFAYTAVDQNGNTAKTTSIVVKITKNRAGRTYVDMANNPAHYAALCLADAGIMTGDTIGGCSFFRPTQTVTRSEFIAMSSAVAALPIEPTMQTDFLDDGGLSAWAKPYVSAAAANGLVSGYQTAGGLAEIRGQNPITLAEASVIVNNLLSENLLDAQPTLVEHSVETSWAQAAINSLNRLDVLSPVAAHSSPGDPITRQTACELLYQAMQLRET